MAASLFHALQKRLVMMAHAMPLHQPQADMYDLVASYNELKKNSRMASQQNQAACT
jgi:hypothetical protein